MPTETQHLEQRVAALQSDLNTKDEQIDALTFSGNDRELSRRSWFDEAKRLEKENEGLKADIRLMKSDLRIARDTAALGVKILAERDALICDVLEAFKLEPDGSCINPGRDFIRPWAEKVAALSASAEPSAQVERNERADFLAWACREYEVGAEEELNERNVVVIQNWAGWKARAALDCPDCGDTGLEPCSKHGWKP